MNKFQLMVRRIKQKVLFEQIYEFLSSKYCTGNKKYHEEWILELTCHTKAKSMKGITDSDLKSLFKFAIETENSQWVRDYVPKIIHKFGVFGKVRGYCHSFPQDGLQPVDKGAIIELMSKVLKRTTGPMPDVALIAKIRKIYDTAKKNKEKISYEKVSEILKKEIGKKLTRQRIYSLYNNKRVAF